MRGIMGRCKSSVLKYPRRDRLLPLRLAGESKPSPA